MDIPPAVRDALLAAATRPGTTTNADLKAAMTELAADDRRDAMLAATPMGREVLEERKAAKFAAGAELSPTIKKMLQATPQGREALKDRGIR